MNTVVDRGLLLEFFLTFACFEYALKASGFLKRHPEGAADLPPAEPDWDRFAVSLRDRFVVTRTPDLLPSHAWPKDLRNGAASRRFSTDNAAPARLAKTQGRRLSCRCRLAQSELF